MLKELLVRVLQGAEYKRNPETAQAKQHLTCIRDSWLGPALRNAHQESATCDCGAIAFSRFRTASSAKTSTLNMRRADTNARKLSPLALECLSALQHGSPSFSTRRCEV